MPHISKKSAVSRDLEDAVQVYAGCIALSKFNKKKALWKKLKILVEVHGIIEFDWYLSRDSSAGRHDDDILDNIIYEFSDNRFLAMFQMHRPSFWHLVDVLHEAGGR